METYAVFGNPINHSLSPFIHKLFAIETGLSHHYGQVLAPLDGFEQTIKQFFDRDGLGANITLPFKERALSLCDQLTERSSLTRAVNTIKKLPDGTLLGDNTDGIGLINDLKRLKLLHKDSRVLLVGAGGAARGVILPLLTYGCKVVITNRTFSRAQEIMEFYKHVGDIRALQLKCLSKPDYNLIINATSTGVQGSILPLPSSIITPAVCCYDMFYQHGDTPFISRSRRHGALRYADGLGMLVGQAASAFSLWHGVYPSILPVIKTLRIALIT